MLEQLLEYLTVASRSTAAITNYVCLVVKYPPKFYSCTVVTSRSYKKIIQVYITAGSKLAMIRYQGEYKASQAIILRNGAVNTDGIFLLLWRFFAYASCIETLKSHQPFV